METQGNQKRPKESNGDPGKPKETKGIKWRSKPKDDPVEGTRFLWELLSGKVSVSKLVATNQIYVFPLSTYFSATLLKEISLKKRHPPTRPDCYRLGRTNLQRTVEASRGLSDEANLQGTANRSHRPTGTSSGDKNLENLFGLLSSHSAAFNQTYLKPISFGHQFANPFHRALISGLTQLHTESYTQRPTHSFLHCPTHSFLQTVSMRCLLTSSHRHRHHLQWHVCSL